jgi:cytochrome b6-f complex iron-sulfur subunit
MRRRSFLLLARTFLRLLAWTVPAALLGWPALSFLTWRKRTMRTVVFRPEEQTGHRLKDGVYLIIEADKVQALSAKCTHLCCTVLYDEGRGVFHCPCHGSEFDGRGHRLRGRAQTDLERLPVCWMEDGSLSVEVPI